MKRIFIDIETLPGAEANRAFAEQRVLRKWRKHEIASDENVFARAVEQEFRDFALRGSLGKLLCVGVIVEENNRIACEGVFGQNKESGEFHLDEVRTLRGFWNYVEKLDFQFDRDAIIGHNIAKFDLPFLYHRSMVAGVRPSKQFLSGKPWETPVFDTFEQWKIGKCSDWVGLEELALAFSLDCPKTDDCDGGKIYDLFAAGKHQTIREYCLRDVRCVREIYYRMNYSTAPRANSEAEFNAAIALDRRAEQSVTAVH